MFLDAFLNLIQPHLQGIYTALIAALVAIAALLAAAMVFRSGLVKILDMVQGYDDTPKVGYQYEEVDKDGNTHYRTWSKKDQYYLDKSRRGR